MSARSLCVLLLMLGIAGPARAQAAKPKPAPPPTETTELFRILQMQLDMKDFANAQMKLPEVEMNLLQVVALVQEKLEALGKNVPILLNADAFRAHGTDPDQVGMPVRLPASPKKRTVHSFLEQVTAQHGATYLLRQGRIEIVPTEYAALDNLLTQPILARYEQQQLRDALQDLADQSGATIVLDPHGGEAAKETITATFRNNATLEDALRICTEQAGLKFGPSLRGGPSTSPRRPTPRRFIQQEQQNTPAPMPRAKGAAA